MPVADGVADVIVDEKDLLTLPANHAFALRPRPGRDLVVNISPRRSFVLGYVEFGKTVLDLADRKTTYFTWRLDELIERINAFIVRNDFRRVTAIGSSKSGFAALAIARKIALLNPDRTFSAISFSGQTRLWPEDPSIHYPSYRNLIASMTRKRALRMELQRHGAIPKVTDVENLTMLLVFGSLNQVDAGQADLLAGSSVARYALPTRAHPTMVPFLTRHSSDLEIEKLAALMEKRAQGDEDLLFSLAALDDAPLTEAIRNAGRQPFLPRLIDELQADPDGVARAAAAGDLSSICNR